MASPFFPPCGFLYRLCPRHRMCIESYKKESGAPAFSSCQIYRRFPALFSYFPLPAFRPAKSAFELFHNALPGQCNRKSGHYIEERRKMRAWPPALSPRTDGMQVIPECFRRRIPRPRYFPFLARQTRKRPEREGGKPSMGEQSPGSWLPSWDQSRA